MMSIRGVAAFATAFGSSFFLLVLLRKEAIAFPLAHHRRSVTKSQSSSLRPSLPFLGKNDIVSKTCLASSSYGGGGDSKSPGFVGFSNTDFSQTGGGSGGNYVAPMQGPGAETSSSARSRSSSNQGYQNRGGATTTGNPSSYQPQPQREGGGASYERDNQDSYRDTYNNDRRDYEEPPRRQQRNTREYRDPMRGDGGGYRDEYLETNRGSSNDYYDNNNGGSGGERRQRRGRPYNDMQDEYLHDDRRRRARTMMMDERDFGKEFGNRASAPHVSYNGRGNHYYEDDERRGGRFNNNDGYPDDRYNPLYEDRERERQMYAPGPRDEAGYLGNRLQQPQRPYHHPNDNINRRGNENFDRAAYDPYMNQQQQSPPSRGDFGVDYHRGDRQMMMNDRAPYNDGPTLFNNDGPPPPLPRRGEEADYYIPMNGEPLQNVDPMMMFEEERQRIPRENLDDDLRPPMMMEDGGGGGGAPPAPPPRVPLGRKERYVRLTPDEMKQPRYSQRYASYDHHHLHNGGGDDQRLGLGQLDRQPGRPRRGRGVGRVGRRNSNASVYTGLSPKEQIEQQRQENFNHGTRTTYFTPGKYGGI